VAETGKSGGKSMQSLLFVALGGAIGSVARFKLSMLLLQAAVNWRFPLGTFAVNVCGCFFIGLLVALAEKYQWGNGDTRLFLITGLLGGFTTFSAFGLETFLLLKRGEIMTAIGYVLLSVIIGLAFLALGYEIVFGKN